MHVSATLQRCSYPHVHDSFACYTVLGVLFCQVEDEVLVAEEIQVEMMVLLPSRYLQISRPKTLNVFIPGNDVLQGLLQLAQLYGSFHIHDSEVDDLIAGLGANRGGAFDRLLCVRAW